MVMMTAGNLSISQSVRQLVNEFVSSGGYTLWNAPTMYEAARVLGEAVRTVHQRDAKALGDFNIDFNISLIFGGQIRGERCRLFQVYAAGNFIESHNENTYFQIGEAKYGKPIIDRVVTPATSLDAAAKCALISMDSTLRSNISVGLPLDLLVYENNSLCVARFVTIDERNSYFQMIRSTWGQQLKLVFDGIEAPQWDAIGNGAQPVRMQAPDHTPSDAPPQPLQAFAQQFGSDQQ